MKGFILGFSFIFVLVLLTGCVINVGNTINLNNNKAYTQDNKQEDYTDLGVGCVNDCLDKK